MTKFGYKISSEEHGPQELVDYARRAEQAGFGFAAISDHFHPWVTAQGHSSFVWAVLGGIAQATDRIDIVTGVTCPSVRIHPAVVAHAAATAGVMLEGRFALGVGSGENLNEHILGDRWPEAPVRLEMLEEAVEVIRMLWEGGQKSHHGRHYTVENARIFDLPERPIPIMVAGSGRLSTTLAGRIGDGFVGLAPDAEMLKTFDDSGGAGKPRYSEVNVCWADDKEQARNTVMEYWPVAGVKGQLMQELPVPALVRASDVDGARRRRGLYDRVRAGRPGAHRGNQEVYRRGLRPRMDTPDRARPRGVFPFLPGQSPTQADVRGKVDWLFET